MIPYFGTPITPETCAAVALTGAHAFVSMADPRNIALAIEVCQSFAVDNGAFSAWRKGAPITNWRPYFEWVGSLVRVPGFDFAVIPDVIDGDEEANDRLLAQWPWQEQRQIGAPVWHLHESIDRLQRLAMTWPRVCLGSSGEFARVGTSRWWRRMHEAFDAICDRDGLPVCKVHGLRMLDPKVFSRFPFASADSTNIARNIGIDNAWRGTYPPTTKEARTAVMRARVEAEQSPPVYDRNEAARASQTYPLFDEAMA